MTKPVSSFIDLHICIAIIISRIPSQTGHAIGCSLVRHSGITLFVFLPRCSHRPEQRQKESLSRHHVFHNRTAYRFRPDEERFDLESRSRSVLVTPVLLKIMFH